MAEWAGTGRWSVVRAGLVAGLTVSLAGCAAGGGSGWAGVAVAAVVAAGLAGCRSGTPETGEAAAAQAPGAEALAAEPPPAEAGAAQATEPEPGAAVAGDVRAPGIDPAWDAEVDAGASSPVPASLGTRPAASESEDEAWSRPQEWRSRRAPPWKGERLEGRVRPKPQAPQVKP